MSKIDDDTRIRHMLAAATRATELISGLQRSDLERKDVVALALVRLLEMLGEAVSGVSPALQMRYPKIL